LQVLMVSFDEVFLAAAEIHHQAHTQGKVRGVIEELDLLRLAVLQNLNIIRRQVRHKLALCVMHRESYIDEIHGYFQLWMLLESTGNTNKTRKEYAHAPASTSGSLLRE